MRVNLSIGIEFALAGERWFQFIGGKRGHAKISAIERLASTKVKVRQQAGIVWRVQQDEALDSAMDRLTSQEPIRTSSEGL